MSGFHLNPWKGYVKRCVLRDPDLNEANYKEIRRSGWGRNHHLTIFVFLFASMFLIKKNMSNLPLFLLMLSNNLIWSSSENIFEIYTNYGDWCKDPISLAINRTWPHIKIEFKPSMDDKTFIQNLVRQMSSSEKATQWHGIVAKDQFKSAISWPESSLGVQIVSLDYPKPLFLNSVAFFLGQIQRWKKIALVTDMNNSFDIQQSIALESKIFFARRKLPVSHFGSDQVETIKKSNLRVFVISISSPAVLADFLLNLWSYKISGSRYRFIFITPAHRDLARFVTTSDDEFKLNEQLSQSIWLGPNLDNWCFDIASRILPGNNATGKGLGSVIHVGGFQSNSIYFKINVAKNGGKMVMGIEKTKRIPRTFTTGRSRHYWTNVFISKYPSNHSFDTNFNKNSSPQIDCFRKETPFFKFGPIHWFDNDRDNHFPLLQPWWTFDQRNVLFSLPVFKSWLCFVPRSFGF